MHAKLEVPGRCARAAWVEHLYVHIPFCPKICPYCSFYKETSDRNKTRPFLEAVLAEARRFADVLKPHTVFFGGGTPTALSTPQLEFLLNGLHGIIDLSEVEEWTFEMNPATVSAEKAGMLRDFGVNRVSMGVQAWQPELLRTLGRVHTAEQAERSFAILRNAGFANLNLDLIFGVPGQTLAHWRESLERTVHLRPEHISAYCLTYEEDTEFFELHRRGVFLQDEEFDAVLFSFTREFLQSHGYAAYEISNFARPGYRCMHNLAYWRGKDYIGLGPSAFSTVGTKRWRNVRNTEVYTQSTLDGQTATDFREDVDAVVRQREKIAFGLRTSEGVPTEWLPDTRLPQLLEQGYVKIEPYGPAAERRIVLTESGALLADEIAAELLEL